MARPRFSRGALLALLAVLVCTALLRLRLLEVPLERDEGEFAYMGQLILRGEVPYVAAHNMKLPGVYYAYAAILALFGESTAAVHLGLLLINLACIGLVFALARRLFDDATGAIAAAAFAALSLSHSVLGYAAKGEHFVVLFMLLGVLLLAGERTWVRLALAGLACGVAFVMKQHAAYFDLFGIAWLALDGYRRSERWRRVVLEIAFFAVGVLVPFSITCLAMAALGAYDEFLFWTFVYAREYVAQIPLGVGLEQLGARLREIFGSSPLLWLLAVVGAFAPAFDPRARRPAPFLLLFAAFSFLAVTPGLRFSEHYFVMLLPAAALLAGAGVRSLAGLAPPRLATSILVALPLLAVTTAVATQRENLFVRSPEEVSREIYGLNPFPEAIEIASQLRQRARPGDELAVIGSEPEAYFLSGLPAATSYIYMYPLMEPQPFAHDMQAKMIAQLEQRRPRFLLFVNVDASWSRQPDSSLAVMQWAERAAATDYTPIGLAELFEGRPARYRWNEEAALAQPESRLFLLLLERRP